MGKLRFKYLGQDKYLDRSHIIHKLFDKLPEKYQVMVRGWYRNDKGGKTVCRKIRSKIKNPGSKA